jgi:hypothetical protein
MLLCAIVPAIALAGEFHYLEKVTLNGVIEVRHYPGPPNFEDIAIGDKVQEAKPAVKARPRSTNRRCNDTSPEFSYSNQPLSY